LFGIAGGEGLDEGDELLAAAGRDMADHPEIEQCHAVARQAQQIARMRIAMEPPVDQHHVQHNVRPQRRDGHRVQPRAAQRLAIARAGALHIVHDQQRLAAPRPVDPGMVTRGSRAKSSRRRSALRPSWVKSSSPRMACAS
jgi:hypothetical protein